MPRRSLGKLAEAAYALYERPPSKEELEEGGFTEEDYAREVEVWPDALDTWLLFREMDTQWHTAGMAGTLTGLNYLVLFKILDEHGLHGDERRTFYDEIRMCEQHALRGQRRAPEEEPESE